MELVTTRVVAGGAALARASDGRIVLVDGALPGERVDVEVTSTRRDHLTARVTQILDPSPARIEMPCEFARAGCGGCGWQHVALDTQRALRVDIIGDALRRIAHVDDAPIRETVQLPPTGSRTTVRVAVVDGRPAFRRAHSHDTVTVDHCLVAHPLVDEVLHTGDFTGASEVTIRAGARTGDRSLLAKPAGVRVDVAADVAQGPRARIHEVIAGRRLRVSARSFFQASAEGADALVALVRDAVEPDQTVVDLYAGVGMFAALLDGARSVVAVEWNRSAVADARANLEGRDATVTREDVARWRARAVDVVIADPSRHGLGRDGASTVLACAPRRVVLVSCDAAALARDASLLRDGGFHLTSVTPVELFPHTPHIECVSVFDR